MSPQADTKGKMKILMAASEATPYAKTGGLADVIGALPPALAARGEEVAVALPLYRTAQRFASHSEPVYDRMHIYLSPRHQYRVAIRRLTERNVPVYFIDCPELYDRTALYGENNVDYADNHVRFAVYCRAVLGILRFFFRADVVHCHDWQSGPLGPMLRHQFRSDPTFAGIRILCTIHNLGYQGLFPREALDDIGLPRELFRPDLLEFWDRINFLKAGIVYADAISTVSRTYALEIQTPEHGFGLDGLLRSRAHQLTGIVNGVDYGEWSPEADPHIAARYSADDLAGKRACKADLLRAFGLPDDNMNRPLIGLVSRFVSQKGFDLIEGSMDAILSEGASFIALGTGDPHYEAVMRGLAERYPARASVRIAYDNTLSHKIEAGADIFLMPSRYEPCGLNQIYSLRYGTVPVVRATGGLEDTIDESTGFKFRDYTSGALLEALRQAVAAYREPERWQSMMRAGMRKDYSWSASAAEYSELYRRLSGPESFRTVSTSI
jgi:starch synthase